METFILPIKLPPELDGGIQTREPVQSAGDFAQLLEKNYASGQGQSGDENVDPQKGTGQSRELPTPVPTESIPMGFLLPSVLEEPNISVPGALESQTAEIPFPPLGLGQQENLPSLSPLGPMAALRFKESLPPIPSQNLEEVATPPLSFSLPEKGIEGGGSIPMGRGVDVFLPEAQAGFQVSQNSSSPSDAKEMSGQTFSPPLPASHEISVLAEKDLSALTSNHHGPVKPQGGKDNVNMGKEGVSLQENRSQNRLTEFLQNLDRETSGPQGDRFSGETQGAIPTKDSKEIFLSPNPSMREDRRVPEFHGRTGASFSEKQFLPTFLATARKDPEGILWMHTGGPNHQGKEIQNLFFLDAAPPNGGWGGMTLVDSLEEGNYQNIPQPVKPGNQEVYPQIVQKMIWMIRAHEERFKLILDPPQLGHIYMEVRRTHENITATLWTDNPATKLTLETSQAEIQKIIECQGFRLEKLDVFVQQDMGRFQGNKESCTGPDPWPTASSLEGNGPIPVSPDALAAQGKGFHPGSKYLNLLV